MRQTRTTLEVTVAKIMWETAMKKHPLLVEVIYKVLDDGMKPRECRRIFGIGAKRESMTHLMIDWIIDWWERDNGLVEDHESIDTLYARGREANMPPVDC